MSGVTPAVTYLAVDTETHAVEPLLAPRLVCMSMYNEAGPLILPRSTAPTAFRQALEKPNVHFIFANAKFDLSVLCNEDPTLLPLVFDALEAGRIHDILIREALIDIAHGKFWSEGFYSLELLARRYLDIDLSAVKSDGWRLRYHELDGVPLESWPHDAREYALNDAKLTYDIFMRQQGGPNLHDEAHQVRSDFALQLMRLWGLRTDPERVATLKADVEKKHWETMHKFGALGIYRMPGAINPATKSKRPWPKSKHWTRDVEVLRALVSKAYNGAPPKSPSGEIRYDYDTLVESGDKTLRELAEAGSNEKNWSQYLKIVEQGAHTTINSEFNVIVVTGRTSSRSPNVQNMPRDERIRNCFVPRPGWEYVDADYSAIEMVVLAQVCKSKGFGSTIAHAINADQDLHVRVARRGLNLSYEDALARVEAGDPEAKDARQLGKAQNYGGAGGMGPKKQAKTAREQMGLRFCEKSGATDPCGTHKLFDGDEIYCNACVEAAAKIKRDWLEEWSPDLPAFFAYISERLTRYEMREDDKGQMYQVKVGDFYAPFSNRLHGSRTFNQACNLQFQAPAADGFKLAAWAIIKECYVVESSPLFGCRVVVPAHDQFLLEAPKGKGEVAGRRMSELMVREMRRVTPDVIVKAKPEVKQYWSKG